MFLLHTAKKSIDRAIDLSKEKNKKQKIFFMSNEMLNEITISCIFYYIFQKEIQFKTIYKKYGFSIIIYPKKA